MTTLTLTPKTHKAKNIIKKWGNTWQIKETRQQKHFIFANTDQTGTPTNLPQSIRWINTTNDPDFETQQ